MKIVPMLEVDVEEGRLIEDRRLRIKDMIHFNLDAVVKLSPHEPVWNLEKTGKTPVTFIHLNDDDGFYFNETVEKTAEILNRLANG